MSRFSDEIFVPTGSPSVAGVVVPLGSGFDFGLAIMIITELEDGGSGDSGGRELVPVKAKRALVGAGGRVLFYPTLLYNVVRNKIEAEFRWWDEVDQVLIFFFFFNLLTWDYFYGINLLASKFPLLLK